MSPAPNSPYRDPVDSTLRKKPTRRAILGGIAAATAGASTSPAQSNSPAGEIIVQGTKAKFTVDYVRPMESVAYTLIQKYGWKITFEEAPLEYAGDIVDVTRDLSRGIRVFNPRGGLLEFSYELGPDGDPPADPRLVLLSAINAYHNADLPGRYTLLVADGYFHIVPIERTNAQGVAEAIHSPLNAAVTVDGNNRLPALVLHDTLRAVEAATGYRIILGHSPFSRGQQPGIQQRFENLQARSVLKALIATTKRSRIWYMMFNSRTKTYYLSIM